MIMKTNQIPQNFHALYDASERAFRGRSFARSSATDSERPESTPPGLSVDFDEATNLPNRVLVTDKSAQHTRQQASSPEESVEKFIATNAELWNLSDEDVASSVDIQSVSGNRMRTVQLVQKVDGIEVFNSEVTAAVNGDNEVVSLAGQLFPGAVRALRSRSATSTTPEQAIALATLDLTNVSCDAAAFVLTDTAAQDDTYTLYNFTEKPGAAFHFTRPVRVKDVLFPLGDENFVPGYYIELWIRDYPAFAYVVDSVGTPDVLYRSNLASDDKFAYRIYNAGDALLRPEDSPAPGSPHPTGIPDGFQATPIDARLVEVESLLTGDPWLPPGATTTAGNNCIAYADLASPDGFGTGDILGKITSADTFDYPYNHQLPASSPTNLQASIVGMFVHVNWLHDRWYEAGFDEAAGNAQLDNYGRGGIPGDPILAEGNDFSGTDNANMATPPDGSSPRMQMYLFRGCEPAMPARTSNFDAMITFHEMGHYITNRLVGNANGLGNSQGRAMGEGWGDFFAIAMTSSRDDDFENGAFPVGGWTDLRADFDNNYYFSIRRYPYSADLTKNPLTFRYISNGVIIPPGVPRNPTSGGPNNEVHNAGEVWCAALWEVFVNLVAQHGHIEAERRALDYVVGGLKLTPNSPTFTQARDGILTAVMALDTSDLPLVWRGFAKRGMGAGAVSPPSNSSSLAGVVENFDVP